MTRVERKVSARLDTIDHKAPFLKVHMRDGDLFVLSSWTVDEQQQVLIGRGDQLGADRVAVPSSPNRTIPLADVALFETNTIVTSPSVAAMAIVTGA
ncbi:MAG TPA: hypothetical protein VGO00_06170, partial [Kofleriaceae bacterium]|nr:hypothetical protein [Kofleriaceae bacterium]